MKKFIGIAEVTGLEGDHVAVMANVDKAHKLAPLGLAIYDKQDKLLAYVELDLMTAATFADVFCGKLVDAAKAAQEQELALSKGGH